MPHNSYGVLFKVCVLSQNVFNEGLLLGRVIQSVQSKVVIDAENFESKPTALRSGLIWSNPPPLSRNSLI